MLGFKEAGDEFRVGVVAFLAPEVLDSEGFDPAGIDEMDAVGMVLIDGGLDCVVIMACLLKTNVKPLARGGFRKPLGEQADPCPRGVLFELEYAPFGVGGSLIAQSRAVSLAFIASNAPRLGPFRGCARRSKATTFKLWWMANWPPPGRQSWRALKIEMVGLAGFEPTTPCPPGRCATRLRYSPSIERSGNKTGGTRVGKH